MGAGMSDGSAMDEGRLEEIEARYKAATGGTWRMERRVLDYLVMTDAEVFSDDDPHPSRDHEVCSLQHQWTLEGGNDESGGWSDEHNAEFIAAAHSDVPDLLAEVRRLRAENDALKQQLQLRGEIEMQVFDFIVIDNPQRPDISIGDPDDLPGRCSIHYRGDKIKALQLLRDALTAFEKYVGQ